jgi:hypothetical protein
MPGEVYNEFYSMGKGTIKYPSLYITKYDEDALSVLLSGLFTDGGDLPVLINYKGKLTELGAMSKTPAHIQKALRIVEVSVIIAEGDVRKVESITDLLEMEDFPWMR